MFSSNITLKICFTVLFVSYYSVFIYSQNYKGVTSTFFGELKNIDERVEKIFIRYSKNGIEIYDSVLVKSSKYRFNYSLNEPTLFVLQPKYSKLKNSKYLKTKFYGQACEVFLEPGIHYISSIDSFSNLTVSNSTANEDYRKISNSALPYIKTLQKLDKIVDSLEKTEDSIILQKLYFHRDSVYEQMKTTVYRKFIEDNPNSPIANYAFKYYADTYTKADINDLTTLFNNLSLKNKLLPTGIEIKNTLRSIADLAINKKAKDFSSKSQDNKEIKLSHFVGKYVLLDFWASWCSPCREQNPGLVKIYNKYYNHPFEIISISLDFEKKNWKSAIKKDNMKWVNISDLKFWNNAIVKSYAIFSIPQNLLIDPQGIIIAKNLDMHELDNILTNVLLIKDTEVKDFKK